jgi:hypothetical protein
MTRVLGWAAAAALAGMMAAPRPASAADTRTPEAIAIQTGLEQVCLPALRQHSEALPKAAGLRRDDGGAYLPIANGEKLHLAPPTAVNPTVCMMTLSYPVGRRKGVLTLLDAWAAAHHLTAVKVDKATEGPANERWTSTWEGDAPAGRLAIAFTASHPLSGDAAGQSQATVLVSLTPHKT